MWEVCHYRCLSREFSFSNLLGLNSNFALLKLSNAWCILIPGKHFHLFIIRVSPAFISAWEVRGQVRSVLSFERFNIEFVRFEQMRGFRKQLLLRENIVWLFEKQQVSSCKWKFLSSRSRIGLDYISDVHLSKWLTSLKEKIWMILIKMYYLKKEENIRIAIAN